MRRRAYVVHRRVIRVGGVRRVVRVVPEAVALLRARRRRVQARVRALRADLRVNGLVAGLRPPRSPSPPPPEPTEEELAARALCESEAVARLEERRRVREARAKRLRETPLPTRGGPGARMGVRQVQAAFYACSGAGVQASRRRSVVMERRLRAAWQRTLAVREAKRRRGEAPLSERVVRRVVARVISDRERAVLARRRAQEDAALAGAARRDLAEWADEERAEERRERRRRRRGAVGEGEEGVEWLEVMRGGGSEECGWLVSGWAV